MTEEQWDNLHDNFETTDLFRTVDHLDEIRSVLSNRDGLQPPEIRDDLQKLHTLAMDVVNHGETHKAEEMFELADDIDSVLGEVTEHIEAIQEVLNNLLDLQPSEEEDFEE